jgi:hypothetical protein
MAVKNPYLDLFINLEQIQEVVTTAGATDVLFNRENPKELHLSFTYNGASTLIRLYPKNGGTCTIGKAPGRSANFELFAEAIKNNCCPVVQQRFECTQKLKQGEFDNLCEFLREEAVTIEELNKETHCRVFAATGPSGDKLRIKYFNNTSTQFQGRYLQTACLVNDFLCQVLDRTEIVSKQIENFKIPISKNQIEEELLHKMPVSNGYVHELVMKQIACSLTLSKIDVAMEDYSSITHSALRALEGFLFQILMVNFKPENGTNVGNYFEPVPGRGYKLTEDRVSTCGHPEMAGVLGECYTYFHEYRHGLFHVRPTIVGTTTINMAEARTIIDTVCNLIETSVRRLKS